MAFFGVAGPSPSLTVTVPIFAATTFQGVSGPSPSRTDEVLIAAATNFQGASGPSPSRSDEVEIVVATNCQGASGPSPSRSDEVVVPVATNFQGKDGPSPALTDVVDFAIATTFFGADGPSPTLGGEILIFAATNFQGAEGPSPSRSDEVVIPVATNFQGADGPSPSRTGTIAVFVATAFQGADGPSPTRTDTVDYLPLGIHESQVEDGTIPLAKIAKPLFDNTLAALQLIADGFFSADANGRAKFANGFFTPAKLAVVPQELLSPLETMKNAASMKDTDETATTDVTVLEDEAKSFADAADQEIKVAFLVPLLYDNTSAITFSIKLSPSTAFAGDFRISAEYRVNGGALSSATTTTITPNAAADVLTEETVLSISAANVDPGDRVLVKLKRLGSDGADSHTGAMRVFQMKQSAPAT